MTVYSFHVFDRRGRTLFTKTYFAPPQQSSSNRSSDDYGTGGTAAADQDQDEQKAEQRKLIFGMLFSLRELVSSITPEGEAPALHTVQTGSSTIHNYETVSGLRFAMYTNNEWYQVFQRQGAGAGGPNSAGAVNSPDLHSHRGMGGSAAAAAAAAAGLGPTVRDALRHIYTEIWVDSVVRSPMYRPGRGGDDAITAARRKKKKPTAPPALIQFDVASTNFERRLDTYLNSMPWFR